MGKRIRDYVKYSLSELECYVKSKTSCVQKVNTPIHLNFPPYGLSNFKATLQDIIAQRKIGFYDARLKGIILDIRNIKVLGDVAALRFDDPAVHLNLLADCYVFQPQVGAIIKGLVKHISERQIGVIIYRVFSVSIRLKGRVPRNVQLNSQIEFRIKKFDLENVMPFFEGELVGDLDDEDEDVSNTNSSFSKRAVKFESNHENASSGYNSDHSHSKPPKTPIKKQMRSDTDSDDSSYLEPGQRPSQSKARSPDIFDDSSSSSDDGRTGRTKPKIKLEKSSQEPTELERIVQKVKRETLSQEEISSNHRRRKDSVSDSEVSEIEPGQRIKEEPLSQPQEELSQRSKKKQKVTKELFTHTDSDLETTRKIKTEKLSQRSDKDTPRKVKEEVDSVNASMKNILEQLKASAPLANSTTVISSESPSNEKHRKRKRTSSIASDSPVPEERRKRRKISHTEPVVTAEIHLDSDFEMTTTTPSAKREKKKKKDKSRDVTNDSTILDPNKVIDLNELSIKKEKKKKKAKHKESEDTSESLSSSLSNILAKIKAEKSV